MNKQRLFENQKLQIKNTSQDDLCLALCLDETKLLLY